MNGLDYFLIIALDYEINHQLILADLLGQVKSNQKASRLLSGELRQVDVKQTVEPLK